MPKNLLLLISCTIFLGAISIFSQTKTVILQEQRSGSGGSTVIYNVEDVAFNWTDKSRADEASFWFQECPS